MWITSMHKTFCAILINESRENILEWKWMQKKSLLLAKNTRIGNSKIGKKSIGNKVLLIIYVCALRLNRAKRLSFEWSVWGALKCVQSVRTNRTYWENNEMEIWMLWKVKAMPFPSTVPDTYICLRGFFILSNTIEFSRFLIY